MDNNSLVDENYLLKLKTQFNLFSNIFSYKKYDDKFLAFLKEIEKPSNNMCTKIFSIDEKAIRCEECGKLDSSIICLDCYEKSKEFHKSHKILYETDAEGGCCDCGNPEVWDKNSFCPSHKGTFSNDEEINNFIRDNFSDDIIKKIQNWCKNIINILVPYFLEMEMNNKLINNTNFNITLQTFLNFLSEIFNSNAALIQIFSQQLIKNYPSETNHNCVIINENNETKIKNYNGKTHICECSFLKILLSVWTNEVKNKDLLFFFLQNNKMKINIGLIFLSIFDKILINNPTDLQSFISQIYNSDIFLKSIKSPKLISNMVKCFYNYLKQKFKDNNDNLEIPVDIMDNFYYDIHFLLRSQTIDLYSDNIELYKNFLDIFELMNNMNVYEIKNSYQKEGFSLFLFLLENFILKMFLYFISIFNFNNLELIKQLLDIYCDKFKKYKFLNSNCYSFHITLIRSFSIFLNRFCFHYSIKNKSNFYDSMKYFIQLIPNYKNIFDIMIKEQMKFFGFLLSIDNNFFIYYGEDMQNYIKNYFKIGILRLIDFNLIKLMLCLDENAKYFSINSILELCNVNNSHKNIISYVFNNLEKPNFYFMKEEKETKNINLNKKILEYFIKFIKDDSSIYKLFDYPLQYKKQFYIKDELEDFLLNNEQNSIKNIIKEKLINFSIIKQNSYKYSEFNENLKIFLFEEKIIYKIFEEMTNKTLQNDGQVKYSLKNDYIKYLDIDYILDPQEISSAQKYIIDFKKKEVSLLNYYFYDKLKIIQKLDAYCYYNFFYLNNNIQFLLNFAIEIMSNSKYTNFCDIFFLSVIKLILIFIYVDKNIIGNNFKKCKNEFYLEIKNKLNKLLNIINNNNIISYKDEDKILLYKYININISQYLNIEIKEKEDDKNKNTIINNKKLKEKYKKKYKEKNSKFMIDINDIEENKESEKCILCHLPLINKNENTIFGIIGASIKDNFIKHCKRLSIKEKFERYNKNSEINFNSFYKDNKGINNRILTCNHKLHFNCYIQLINNILFFSDKIRFDCPLCKKMCNIFIPCLHNILIYDDYNNNIEKQCLSGFKITDFYDDNFIKKAKIEESIFLDSTHSKIQDILNSSISFIENFFDGKLISFLNNPNNYPTFFNILIEEFNNFLIYYYISDDSKSQIIIWTNLILCLRVLLKTKMLKIDKFIIEFYNSFNIFDINENMPKNIIQNFFNDSFSREINKIIFLSLILFDFDNPENLFIDLFSPFISIVSFIKKLFIENELYLSTLKLKNTLNIQMFKNYINDSNIYKESYLNLKISFDIFLEKICIFSLINNIKKNQNYFNNNNENNKIIFNQYKLLNLESFENKPFPELILKLNEIIKIKDNNSIKIIFYKKMTNEKLIEIIFKHFSIFMEKVTLRLFINQDLLIFGNKLFFKFIPLEKTLLEHYIKVQKQKCIYCDKDNQPCLICLLCGAKICENICISNKNKLYNKRNDDTHSLNCNFGNIAYISDLGNINFYYHGYYIYSFNGIYLNQFGEEYKSDQSITKDYILMEKNYQNIEKMFINYSYRKNSK